MHSRVSIWLDLFRVLAAAAVFVGHSRGLGVAPDWIGLHWHRTAEDAVVAFFVISGYVIAWSTERSIGGIRAYVEARASRIYSVAIPAVLAALLLDHVGMRYDPTQYAVDWQYPRLWLYLPFHWLFLGGTWFGPMDPFSMASYWSLPYEVWYYVFFGCITLLRGVSGTICATIALALMGPRMWLLLPCWYLGVWLYRSRRFMTLPPGLGGLLAIAAMGSYVAFVQFGARHATDVSSKALYAWINLWLPSPFVPGGTVHALTDYVIALLFAALLVGCANSSVRFGTRATQAIRWMAGYTFTLYLIHFSILVLFSALGWQRLDGTHFAVVVGVTLAATWLVGQVGEVRRSAYRKAISRLIDASATVLARLRAA